METIKPATVLKIGDAMTANLAPPSILMPDALISTLPLIYVKVSRAAVAFVIHYIVGHGVLVQARCGRGS
jgi:hypothetical protein